MDYPRIDKICEKCAFFQSNEGIDENLEPECLRSEDVFSFEFCEEYQSKRKDW